MTGKYFSANFMLVRIGNRYINQRIAFFIRDFGGITDLNNAVS